MVNGARTGFGAICIVLGIGAAILLPAGSAHAQFATPRGVVGGIVSEIRIEGSQRIAPETVRAYVTLQPGEAADAEQLDKSLKALFGTGLFADVAIRQEGSALVVRVVENPIVNRIAFEGNRRMKDDILNGEISLRPRTVFTRAKVQSDVKRLQDVYRRTGRFAATVEPKVIQLPQNRVDLVYEIDEGQITSVQRINFVGNKTFADGTLREQIQTRESRWFRFLSNDDVYDPDRLSYDRELLRKYYLSYGYADFRVVSAIAELSPDREGFYVTFTIEEGERYRFGNIDVSSQLRDLKVEDLKARVKASQGSWYDADLVDGSVTALTDFAGSAGYAFAEVRPRVTRDREARTVSIVFEVQEGPRVYVERINIVGNVRTVDKVIRREVALVEGDAFNTSKMRTSRKRIQNLQFFDRVEVTNVPGESPDRTVVNVEVNEKSTGELTFGVGFSTADGPLFDTSIRERNLLGRGQDLRLGGTISRRRNQLDLSFTSPYFLDRDMAAGFDVFRLRRDFQREAGYDFVSTGFVLRDSYNLSESVKQQVRYTLRNDDITSVSPYAASIVQDAAGAVLQSGFGHTTTYDKRDDTVDPTDGYAIKLANDVAGAGGDAKFLKSTLSGQYYFPIAPEYTFALLGEASNIFAYSNDIVRMQHRLQLGGDNFRGFRTAGLGPRDRVTGNALGGNRMYVGTAELAFPTGLPRELGLRGTLFSDFGALSTFDRPKAGRPGAISVVDDSNRLRVSVGAGVNWRSPFGPIRVALAKAIVKEEFDKTELFRFSFGSRF
ncbi:MAG: outer membrane protein assembly factor BamA [Proteobacteria bacterium]|nr:outer membrane protein assembly factor BamA [Pseudomonadota bacterium]